MFLALRPTPDGAAFEGLYIRRNRQSVLGFEIRKAVSGRRVMRKFEVHCKSEQFTIEADDFFCPKDGLVIFRRRKSQTEMWDVAAIQLAPGDFVRQFDEEGKKK